MKKILVILFISLLMMSCSDPTSNDDSENQSQEQANPNDSSTASDPQETSSDENQSQEQANPNDSSTASDPQETSSDENQSQEQANPNDSSTANDDSENQSQSQETDTHSQENSVSNSCSLNGVSDLKSLTYYINDVIIEEQCIKDVYIHGVKSENQYLIQKSVETSGRLQNFKLTILKTNDTLTVTNEIPNATYSVYVEKIGNTVKISLR